MSVLKARSKAAGTPYDTEYIGLTCKDRAVLYERIDKRVDEMLRKGLVQEAFDLYKSLGNGTLNRTCQQALGYKELIPYFLGEAELSECIGKIKQETRRYAKRQITWFSRNAQIKWVYIDVCC
jgi:tRNA dimethylallyltransferase